MGYFKLAYVYINTYAKKKTTKKHYSQCTQLCNLYRIDLYICEDRNNILQKLCTTVISMQRNNGKREHNLRQKMRTTDLLNQKKEEQIQRGPTRQHPKMHPITNGKIRNNTNVHTKSANQHNAAHLQANKDVHIGCFS